MWLSTNRCLRTPSFPNPYRNPEDELWFRDSNQTADNPWIYVYEEGSGKWVMSSRIGPVYVCSNYFPATPNSDSMYGSFQPIYQSYNGKMICQHLSAYGEINVRGKYLWYDGSNWIISASVNSEAYEYFEWYSLSDKSLGGEYKGPDWWSAEYLPSESGESVIFKARGQQRGDAFGEYNGTELEVYCQWERLEHVDGTGFPPFGEYQYQGEIENTYVSKFVGTPQWIDQNGKTYTRNIENIYAHWIYGDIHYVSDGQWRRAHANGSCYWMSNEEPTKDHAVTFYFYDPLDTGTDEDDLIVSFDKYVKGDLTEKSYIAQVPIWL